MNVSYSPLTGNELEMTSLTVSNSSNHKYLAERQLSSNLSGANEDLGLIYLILVEGHESNTQGVRKVNHVYAKVFLSLVCYVSKYPSLAISKKNFNSIVLQNLFAYGNAFAWGTVATFCGINIYDDLVEKNTLTFRKNVNTLAAVAHWSAVTVLGLSSVLPLSYTIYNYNKNALFWCVFNPIITSFFQMLSIHTLLTEVFSKNDSLKKFYLNVDDLRLFRVQNQFCKLLEYSHRSLSNNYNEEFAQKFEKTTKFSNDKKIVSQKLIVLIIQQGKLEVISRAGNKSPRIYCVEKGIKIISNFLPLGSPIVDSILISKGFHLISNQNWPIPVLIFFAVGPGVYLQIKLTKDFYLSVFNKLIELKSGDSHQIEYNRMGLTALKSTVIGTLTVLGLASDTTVVRDNVGFDNVFKVLVAASLLSTLAIILTTSMNCVSNDLVKFYQTRKQSVEQLKYENMLKKIKYLGDYFMNLPKNEFLSIFNEVDLDDSLSNLLGEENFKEKIISFSSSSETI